MWESAAAESLRVRFHKRWVFFDGKPNVTDSQRLSDAGGVRDYMQFARVLSKFIAIGTPLSVFFKRESYFVSV